MTEIAQEPSSNLPSPPRAITRRARRRSWAELPVRFWLMVTVILAGATIFIAIRQLADALPRRWLIQNGTVVHAKFTGVEGDDYKVGKHLPRDEPKSATIEFTLPSGQRISQSILLDARPGAFAQVGAEFVIRVDPDDPNRWTESDTPLPWTHELLTSLMLVPVVLVLALITFLRRAQMLRVWVSGEAIPATVVESRQTAMAPRSRIVRFIVDGLDDPRIYSALLPVRWGIPAKGEHLWIIRRPENPANPVIAAAYGENPAQSSINAASET